MGERDFTPFDTPFTREELLKWRAQIEGGQTRLSRDDWEKALAWCDEELKKLETQP